MDAQNVVAARLGLPFKCGMCSKVHKKADLSNKDVCLCFAKAWESALGCYRCYPGWFSENGRELICKPTWEFIELHDFNVPKITYSYPIEQDVFMLAFSVEKTIESLRKKFVDWNDDCIKQQVIIIEEKGKWKNVKIIDGGLYINDYLRPPNYYPTALLMMKSQEIALALACINASRILDIEWRSLKKSAKILMADHFEKEKFTIFASEETGVVKVSNRIHSVLEAENYLRQLDSHEKNIATLRALFRITDYVIRYDIPRLFSDMSNLDEHREQLILHPLLDESRMQDARVILKKAILSLNQIGFRKKYHLIVTIEACINALNALEKAYKSISNNTSNDTIEDNLSQALYWITKTHKESRV
jgi:ribosomal protein S6